MTEIYRRPENVRHFEDFLDATGWGIYYKYMLCLVCCCNFLHAATLLTVPFAVSISGCPNSVPYYIVFGIFMFYLTGRSFGGFSIACMSDRYGRKRELMYSVLTIFVATFVSAFAYNYYIIMGTSFFLGLGLEGTANTIKTLFIETLPSHKRGFYMFLTNISWTLGYISMSVFALFMEYSYYVGDKKKTGMYLSTWRITYALCGGLSLLVACCAALLEESSRHFLSVGKLRVGYLVLKQFYAINKSSYAENFEIKEEEMKDIIHYYDLNYEEPDGYCTEIKLFLWRIFKSIRLLFSRQFVKVTLLLTLLKTPFLIFGYIGYAHLMIPNKDETGCGLAGITVATD